MSDKKQPKIRFKGFADDWEQRKWSETVDISTDMVDPKTGEFDNLPHIGPGNIESFSGKLLPNVRTVHDSHLISGKFHFFPGNIIYGKINPQLGKYVLPNFEGLSSADTYVLNAKNGLNQYFLFGLIQTNNFYKYSVSVSMRTGMPKINRDELDQYIFSAPSVEEQKGIGLLLLKIQNIIAANQHKLDELKQLKKLLMQKIFSQEWRFRGFTDPWEQRQLGDIFKKVNERNNGQFGKDKWISVANMYFQDIAKVQSNNIDTRTYVMRKGDIAFEGHPNKEHKFGRFVENDIGPGIISELFPIYRHKGRYDLNYWKIAIKIEKTMEPIFARSLTSSGNSSNKIDEHDFLRQSILVPSLDEQTTIGFIFAKMSDLIAANQQKLTQLKQLKKYLMQNMFV